MSISCCMCTSLSKHKKWIVPVPEQNWKPADARERVGRVAAGRKRHVVRSERKEEGRVCWTKQFAAWARVDDRDRSHSGDVFVLFRIRFLSFLSIMRLQSVGVLSLAAHCCYCLFLAHALPLAFSHALALTLTLSRSLSRVYLSHCFPLLQRCSSLSGPSGFVWQMDAQQPC